MCFDPIVEYWRLHVDLVLYMLRLKNSMKMLHLIAKKGQTTMKNIRYYI
jgi:phage-related protein